MKSPITGGNTIHLVAPQFPTAAMNNGNSKKRPPPSAHQPPQQQQQQKHHAAMDEEEMDEDVFLDETLLYEEEAQVLRDIEERQALSSRLSKWKRPTLSPSYLSQSQNIGKSIATTAQPEILFGVVLAAY